jgi:hypothetical protein
MRNDRYMMLTGLGHALRCDPESRVKGIIPRSDPDGFEMIEIIFEGGYSRGIAISGKPTAQVLREIAQAIESKETLERGILQ